MNIRLHIERVVLDGLDLNRAEAERVQGGLEAELTRLLSEGKLASYLLSGGSYPSLKVSRSANVIDTPEGIGRQVAQKVYGGIGKVE